MITLTRIDGTAFVLNCDHILTAEETPDTTLTLTTGLKVLVRESAAEVVERAASWRRRTFGGPIVVPHQ